MESSVKHSQELSFEQTQVFVLDATTRLRSQEDTSMLTTTTEIALWELDHRTNDGIDVTLLWNPRTNHVFVVVEDQRSAESFELEVEAADALNAFRHPFAYANNDYDDRSVPLVRLPASPRRRAEER